MPPSSSPTCRPSASAYPGHNLVRTRAQFKLLTSAEAHEAEMQAFIASC